MPEGKGGLSDAKRDWLKAAFGIDPTFDDAAAGGDNPFGFKTKDLSAEYVGEENKAQWRDWAPGGTEDPNLTTRHYDAEEKKARALSVNAKGEVCDAAGKVVQNKTSEYALDPETGEMVLFTQTFEQITEAIDGSVGRTPVPMGEVRGILEGGGKVEATHHSTAMAGEAVANAGMVTVDEGLVTRISNASGHYKPQLVQMLQTVEFLAKQGANLDKTMMIDTGIDGQPPVDLADANPKAAKLHKAIKQRQKRAEKLLAEASGLDRKWQESESEEERAGLDVQIQAALTALAKIEIEIKPAQDLLRKLGVSERNKIKGKVDFTEAAGATTGGDFKTKAKTTTAKMADFMRYGGNEKPPEVEAAEKGAGEDQVVGGQEALVEAEKPRGENANEDWDQGAYDPKGGAGGEDDDFGAYDPEGGAGSEDDDFGAYDPKGGAGSEDDDFGAYDPKGGAGGEDDDFGAYDPKGGGGDSGIEAYAPKPAGEEKGPEPEAGLPEGDEAPNQGADEPEPGPERINPAVAKEQMLRELKEKGRATREDLDSDEFTARNRAARGEDMSGDLPSDTDLDEALAALKSQPESLDSGAAKDQKNQYAEIDEKALADAYGQPGEDPIGQDIDEDQDSDEDEDSDDDQDSDDDDQDWGDDDLADLAEAYKNPVK